MRATCSNDGQTDEINDNNALQRTNYENKTCSVITDCTISVELNIKPRVDAFATHWEICEVSTDYFSAFSAPIEWHTVKLTWSP